MDHLKEKIDRALKKVKADLPVKVDLAKREAAETKQRIKRVYPMWSLWLFGTTIGIYRR